MKDDFDNGMGMPDDEIGGGPTMSDLADTAAGLEDDLIDDFGEPAGRPSGGARARKAAFVPRAISAGKPKATAKKKPAKKKSAKKVAKKAAKKKAPARKAKAARKGTKKRARAGKKK